MAGKTPIKIGDATKGVTQAENEVICKAPGVEPDPPAKADSVENESRRSCQTRLPARCEGSLAGFGGRRHRCYADTRGLLRWSSADWNTIVGRTQELRSGTHGRATIPRKGPETRHRCT